MSRTHLLTGLALLVAGAIGLSQLGRGDDDAPGAAAPPAIRVEGEDESTSEVLVHVAGEVRRPGVLRLRAGMRVDDAVRLAGGATRRADLSAVNLAAKVQDGKQVLVPAKPRRGAAVVSGGAGTPGGPPAGPVNLNTATLEQLDGLDGIGPTTAQKILAAREERGGFGSVDELGEIPGIGAKRLASLREAVTV
jgi:competence protein ComEA